MSVVGCFRTAVSRWKGTAMRFSPVGKFFAAFATVAATGGAFWIVSASALPPGRPVDPAAATDRSSAVAPGVRNDAPVPEPPSQSVAPDGLHMSVRTPFGAFNFGFELDRM
jgi:hypothetical protein